MPVGCYGLRILQGHIQDIWEQRGNPGISPYSLSYPKDPRESIFFPPLESPMLVWCARCSVFSSKKKDLGIMATPFSYSRKSLTTWSGLLLPLQFNPLLCFLSLICPRHKLFLTISPIFKESTHLRDFVITVSYDMNNPPVDIHMSWSLFKQPLLCKVFPQNTSYNSNFHPSIWGPYNPALFGSIAIIHCTYYVLI